MAKSVRQKIGKITPDEVVDEATKGMATCLGKLNIASSGAEANLTMLKEYSPNEFFMWQKRLRACVRDLIMRHGY